VDDHAVVRDALRALLETEDDIVVAGEAGDGRSAVRMARELLPDVVVMDIAMPLLNGIEATRQILKERPATRVLLVSAHSEDAYIEQVVGLRIAGYMTKQDSALVLEKAIREAYKGNTFFSACISDRFREIQQHSLCGAGARSHHVASILTPREVEIFQLIAEGKANKQSASELGISIKTVEKHRHELTQRLGVHSIAELTRYAVATGVIESGLCCEGDTSQPTSRCHFIEERPSSTSAHRDREQRR